MLTAVMEGSQSLLRSSRPRWTCPMAWHGMYMMQQSQQTASMPKVYYTADCVAVGPSGHLSYRWNEGRLHRRREVGRFDGRPRHRLLCDRHWKLALDYRSTTCMNEPAVGYGPRRKDRGRVPRARFSLIDTRRGQASMCKLLGSLRLLHASTMRFRAVQG